MARAHAPSKSSGSSPTSSSDRDTAARHPRSLVQRGRKEGLLRAAGPAVGLGVQRSVQPAPIIGRRGDRYEQEADAVAQRVVAGRTVPPISRVAPGALRPLRRQANEEDVLQRQARADDEEPVQRQVEPEEEPVQMQGDMDEEETVQMQEAEEEPVQARSESGRGGGGSMRAVAARAIRTRGPGRPMHGATRRAVEQRLGVDLRGVRIHDGPQAQTAASALHARAFTHGRDIWLARGASDQNVRLMAHEATHVVQQGAAGAGPPVQRREEDEEPVQRRTEEDEPVQRQVGTERDEDALAAGIVQRGWFGDAWGAVKSAAGAVAETAGNAFDAIAEKVGEAFWAALRRVLPAPAVEFLREVQNNDDGIIGALYAKMKDFAGGIFDALAEKNPSLKEPIAAFRSLLARAEGIVQALVEGDCEPLFQAISDFKALVADVAGGAWEKITSFLQPVADFLEDVWEKVGSPIVDWVKEAAGGVWETIQTVWSKIQSIGSKLASIASTVGSALWGRIKDILGFGGESDGESGGGGVIAWIKDKANAAWEKVSGLLQPIVEPAKNMVAKVQSLLPLSAIQRMQETVQSFQERAGSMDSAAGSPDDVVRNQKRLREAILPAVLGAIDTVSAAVGTAKSWLTSTIQGLTEPINAFFASLQKVDVLSAVAGALDWIRSGVATLQAWAVDVVGGIFDLVTTGLQKMKAFARPVYRTLMKVAGVLSDFVGGLKALIGSVWTEIPACIREKIEDFLINKILANVPFFGKLVALKEAWNTIVDTAYRALYQVFVDGDLLGAAWTVFQAFLRALGLPPELVVALVNNALKAFHHVFSDPIGFLINIAKSVQLGFQQFIDNFGTHILGGLQDWVFGALRENGIEPPTEFSFQEVFRFLMEVFDVTLDRILDKVATHLGVDRAVIDRMIARVQEVVAVVGQGLEWLQTLMTDGPAALWTWLQDKITGLWDTVQSQIIEYISINVIQRVAAKLALALTPTGVSQVVAVVETIWSAIQAAVEYIRQIIEVVNSVFESVIAIAQGSLAPAAARIESTLARMIPVAIGFLAHQVGLGDLPRRLGTILERVRSVVDRGLDRLIGGAIGLLRAAVRAVRRGVGRLKEAGQELLQWWTQTASFSREGETHEVTFSGEEENARLVVASTPKPLATFLAEERQRIQESSADADQKKNERDVLDQISEHAAAIDAIKARTRDGFGKADGEAIRTHLQSIARRMGALSGERQVPDSQIEFGSPITQTIPGVKEDQGARLDSRDATGVEATILSIHSPVYSGSQPGYYSALYKQVQKHPTQTYVEGHLLNHHVHGPGVVDNLTPITTGYNTAMEGGSGFGVEEKVKDLVLGQGGVAYFKVDVAYGGRADREESSPEHYLPTALSFQFHKLKRKENTSGAEASHWTKDDEATDYQFNQRVAHDLPREPVEEAIETAAHVLEQVSLRDLSVSGGTIDQRQLEGMVKTRLMTIDNVGETIAGRIVQAATEGQIRSWADVERIEGVGPAIRDAIQTMEGVHGRMFYVGATKTTIVSDG